MKIETAIDEFLLGLKAEGAALATVKWYGSLLRAFSKRVHGELEAITAKRLREYLADTRERAPESGSRNQKIAPETLYTHHRALNTFFLWCSREYGVLNPMANIKRPRRPKPNPKGVNHGDVVKMFDVAVSTRDKLILAWLTDTACRVSELCAVKVADIDLERCQVVTVGKGDKPRMLLFSPFTRDLVKLWLSERQSDSDYLITGRLEGHMTRYGITRVLKRLAKKAGVTGRFNPHAFRHGFAKEYLMNGGDISSLSKIFGHSSAAFTADVYGLFDIASLATVHLKNSPIHILETKNQHKMR